MRRYILDDQLKANNVLISGSKVFIGPRVPDKERMKQKLEKLAWQAGLGGPKFIVSEIDYRKVW